MSFRVSINFDDGSSELLDEVFETEEDAEDEAIQWASDYSQGGNFLKEAGEEYCEQKVVDWDIYEE